MSGIDIFALIVLITIFAVAIGVFVFLGQWPGKVAHANNHPQAEAITIGSWVGLIAGGVLWPLILIWAYVKYPDASNGESAGTAISDQEEQAS
ncbi:MAG: hypothetical protein AseanaTS_12600 [Candidatus Pelagadaptatus aseana]|uniref:DUF3302 domain-containing protein n=1 Tax=Candidatus Pelagadaptatus aseana TaxID=3120508 RepID=UPI0039B169A1